MNSAVKELEQSLNSTEGVVDTLKKQFKTETEQRILEMKLLRKKIADLEQSLKEEVERNTNLEQYTRPKNLIFNDIKESEDKGCKEVIYNIIERDLGIDTSRIRFHAVHRVGKRNSSRCRPIIARFICREDRYQVWFKRGKIKKSKCVHHGRLRGSHPKGTRNFNQG